VAEAQRPLPPEISVEEKDVVTADTGLIAVISKSAAIAAKATLFMLTPPLKNLSKPNRSYYEVVYAKAP
jgi:hypothetical protein